MKNPRLSIGLPVYNGEKYLRRALDSLLGQDFGDFELIISDNASTDGTTDICKDYARQDSRIRYFQSQSNRGATWNYRHVFDLAHGEDFKWAASDDECYPTMLRRCVDVLKNGDPSVTLVYPRTEFIDDTGKVIVHSVGRNWDRVATAARTPHQRLRRALVRNLYGQSIYGVIRAKYLRQGRPFGRVAADWVKVAELAMQGKIVEVPEVLFRYRVHPHNSSLVANTQKKLLAWHDPSQQNRAILLPYDLAIILEDLKSIRHLQMTRTEKMLCYWVALATPPCRGIFVQVPGSTGAARVKIREQTGWKWIAPGFHG